MFNENAEKVGSRYTVSYYGSLFYGDSEGLNFHDYDRWEDVLQLIEAFGDYITVDDNYYGVKWSEGGVGVNVDLLQSKKGRNGLLQQLPSC